MEANRRSALACVCALALMSGCTEPWGDQRVKAQDTSPPAPSADVQSTSPADSVNSGMNGEPIGRNLADVQRWVAHVPRLDDLSTRVGQRRTAGQVATREKPAIGTDAPDQPKPPVQAAKQDASVSDVAASSPDIEPAPPIIRGVDLHAEPIGVQLARDSSYTSVEANAPERAGDAPRSSREVLDEWLARLDDNSFRDQLDRRVLLALSGEFDRARAPFELVTDEQQAVGGRFVEALIAVREGHGGDPQAEFRRVLGEVDLLRESLRKVADLRITTLAICRSVQGFGQYEPIEPATFRPGGGMEFVAYCELADFASEPDEGGYVSRFAMRTTVLSRAGDRVLELSDDLIVDRCRTRRRDCFIPRLVRLPSNLSAGQYVVKVTIIDKLGEKVAEERATIRVEGSP